MMSTDFHFRDKVPVVILGATGCVGQRFIQLLEHHPWFTVAAVCASERSVGKRYGEVVKWLMATPIPSDVAEMVVQPCDPSKVSYAPVAFSGLDASIAGEVEKAFAEKGSLVVSNCSHYRMHPHVPLLVAEVNPEHIGLCKTQSFGKGMIVTNPNCSVTGLVLALKPLVDQFGVEAVQVCTLQAVSGAGYPGVPGLDILDNIIPFIRNEEEKVETEPLKILGRFDGKQIDPYSIRMSAQCNRVPVLDGHMACVSVKLQRSVEQRDILEAWNTFQAEPQQLNLPMAPFKPLHYFSQEAFPQPRLHRDLDKGMAVSLGRLRHCPLLDYKFALLSHNTLRGAAGAAVLNAELLLRKGLIYW